MDIVIQAIGGLGLLVSIISFQCKKHRSILFFRGLNEFVFAIHYFLLGAYVGMIADLVGCVRNVIFTKQIENGKKTTVSSFLFSGIFVILGLVFWQGSKSLLTIFAKVLSTLAYGNKNPSVVRGVILITSTCWLVYNICVFSIAGIACEAFTVLSICVGIIRLDLIPAVKKQDIQQAE